MAAAPRTTVRNLTRTRDKILAAALAEFSARGFAGARVDVIARRARVNKRMLYCCFGTKQDLNHGMEPTDPRFMRQRANFLRWLGDRLAKPAAPVRVQTRRRRNPIAALHTAVARGQSPERPVQLA